MRDTYGLQGFQTPAPLSYPRWLLAPLSLYWPPRIAHTFYLTIDDGPHSEGLSLLLPLLAQYEARATFFWLARPEAALWLPKLRAGGHTLGLHGLSHVSPWRQRRQRWREEVQTAWNLLSQLWGRSIPYYRPPYGHYRRLPPTLPLKTVLWDHLPPDYRVQAGWSKAVLRRLKAGDVVVLHERPEPALPEWEALLAGAQSLGLQAVALP